MIQEDKEVVSMKSIEERAWEQYPEAIKHHNLACIDINEEKRKMYIEIATEQKAIDDAKWLKIKSSWEKEAQINHDDVANYKQGYHDAIEKACKACKNELRRLKILLDESVGVPANLMPVDKSLSRIRLEMEEQI